MRSRKNILFCLALALILSLGFVFALNNEDSPVQNRIIINADLGKDTIDKNIYGHFSEHLGRCIYDGYWAGEDSSIKNVRGIRSDIVEALKKIKIPVLRWPGGCFADEYHWKDGIGPRKDRPAMINTHWGRVTENNHFGTHEFLDLCEQLGCEPYICGNVGSGTVREMQEWIEYITFDGQSPMADLRWKNGREEPWKLKFFGVGNENWGCGGNMTPEHYANLYRRYQTYVRSFSGKRIYRIACGSYGENYKWTDVLMREAGRMMRGLSFHYYIVPGGWGNKNSATQFEEKDWFETLQKALFMDELLNRHSAIMDRYDPNKRVGMIVDEWGTWYLVEPGTNPSFLYQQNSLRDAVVAGAVLNIFNSHCERVKMANLAQTINVLQSLILTQGEKMVLTPTYHVFDMYKIHQDAILLPVDLECRQYEREKESIPALSASASQDKTGKIHVSLCNLDPNQSFETVLEFRGVRVNKVKGTILTDDKMTAHNTFENPENLKPAVFRAAQLKKGNIVATLPPKSVVVLEVNTK
jgi:alpha-N-arabinofuranosidase